MLFETNTFSGFQQFQLHVFHFYSLRFSSPSLYVSICTFQSRFFIFTVYVELLSALISKKIVFVFWIWMPTTFFTFFWSILHFVVLVFRLQSMGLYLLAVTASIYSSFFVNLLLLLSSKKKSAHTKKLLGHFW